MSERTKSKTANFLAFYLDLSPLSQKRVAELVGYKKANVLSMFKSGETPVPISKIPQFAKVLNIDPKKFMRVALNEYQPELLEAIEEVYGVMLSEGEERLVNLLRDRCGADVDLQNESVRRKINTFLDELCGEKPALDVGESYDQTEGTSSQN